MKRYCLLYGFSDTSSQIFFRSFCNLLFQNTLEYCYLKVTLLKISGILLQDYVSKSGMKRAESENGKRRKKGCGTEPNRGCRRFSSLTYPNPQKNATTICEWEKMESTDGWKRDAKNIEKGWVSSARSHKYSKLVLLIVVLSCIIFIPT